MKKKKHFPWPGKYTFVDVEIANIKNDCVCAVSMIVVEDHVVQFRHTEKINPRSFFSGINISIHHITPQDVLRARSFLEFWRQYGRYFTSEYTIVGHNVLSDISVMDRDLARVQLTFPAGRFIDTMDLGAQEFYHGKNGKGDLKLDRLAANMNIALEHHNPASDVNACFEIFLKLYDAGFRNLEQYVKEIRLKSRIKSARAPVRRISRARYLKDIQSRKFQPYFQTSGTPVSNAGFDPVTLQDLQNCYIPEHAYSSVDAIANEEKTIRSFLESIGAKPAEKREEASAVIEFLIPDAKEYDECQKQAQKLFHSLDVLEFIQEFEKKSKPESDALYAIVQQSMESLPKEAVQDGQLAADKGLLALKEGDLKMAVYFLERAVYFKSRYLQVYRQLADLYHRYGFYEEEKRVLRKGIALARSRHKSCVDLQRRLERIRKKEKRDEKDTELVTDHIADR